MFKLCANFQNKVNGHTERRLKSFYYFLFSKSDILFVFVFFRTLCPNLSVVSETKNKIY